MDTVKLMLAIAISFLLMASTAGSAFAGANIEVSFNTTTAKVGDQVTMVVLITNTGPGDLSGITVSAPIPAGLNLMTFVASGNKQIYDPATGVWQVDNLKLASKDGGKKTLTITAEVQPAAAGKKIKATAAYLSVYNGTPPVLLPLTSSSSQLTIKSTSTNTGSQNGTTNTASTKSNSPSSISSNSKLDSIVSTIKEHNASGTNPLNSQKSPKAYNVFNEKQSKDNVPITTSAIVALVGVGILVVVGYFFGIRKL